MNSWVWLTVFSVVGLLVTALLHWVPWNRLLKKELEPPWTYVAGLAPLLALHSVWAIVSGFGWLIALAPWAIVGAAGVGDIGAYRIDKKAGDRLYRAVFGGTDGVDHRLKRD